MQQRAGIDARRAERDRKKTIGELQKRGDHIPIELLTLIPDPDIERKIEELKESQLAEENQEIEDQVQSDDGFIAFEYTEDEDEEEEEEEEELDPFRDLIDPNLYT